MKVTLRHKIASSVKQPWFIIFFLSIFILAFAIIFIGIYRPFNSDDVYWQLSLQHWSPFNGTTFYFGDKDIFIVLSPVFAIMQHIWHTGRGLIILESLALTVSSFTLFYFASLYFLKKLNISLTYKTLLPFVWLSSFGYPIVSWYLNPNWRSFEIGFSFVTFALIFALAAKDIRIQSAWSKIASLFFVLFTGLLMISDPYYTFFTIAPSFLLVVILHYTKMLGRRNALLLYAGFISSYLVSKLFESLIFYAGIRTSIDTPSVFVDFSALGSSVLGSIHAMTYMFNADFLGRQIISPNTIITVVNLFILSCIISRGASHIKKLRNSQTLTKASVSSLIPLFVSFLMALLFTINTLSTLSGIANYRFYMLFAYLGTVILAIAIGSFKNTRYTTFVVIALLVASIANIVQTGQREWLTTDKTTKDNTGNSLNLQTISAIKSLGQSKGYANFWQANINTYLSNSATIFLPTMCNEHGESSKFRWLITSDQFDKTAQSSFFFIDSRNQYPEACTKEEVIKQFGVPSQINEIPGGTVIIFDYDISTKMP